MTVPGTDITVGTPRRRLAERCAALGMPCWQFDASGREISGPGESGGAGAWLRTRVVSSFARDAAALWAMEEPPGDPEVFPGARLIPLQETRRRRRLSLTLAMALAPEALEGETFRAACAEAGLDEGEARSALAGMAVFPREAAVRVGEALGWAHADLAELDDQRFNVDSLSRQLAESYEEMTLLYQLRESMNELAHPDRFVKQACFELHQVMPFRWVGARFADDPDLARALAGRTVHVGTLPCPEPLFRSSAGALLASLRPGRSEMLDAETSPLAVRGSQAFAHPIVRSGQVVGALLMGDKRGEDAAVTTIEMKMVEAAAGYVAILMENASLYEDQHAMFLGTLRALTASIDAKDPYTRGHSERVADLAAEIARAAGLPEAQVERVRIAGLVHDVGKIGVPEAVLRKPGRLSDAEFEAMKAHPEIGYHILRDIPQMADVLPGVLHHHERYEGGGYPTGIAGEEIPLVARIIALADSFDAMSSNRTYRPAMTRKRVLDEIRANAGRQFDPRLAAVFERVDLREYDRAVARHLADSERERPGGPRGAAA